ncbi:MAG TPA: class F sortase, partial [Micromonosporaceae bacterium]|nr:class F sortase [Micromonosporaceae bacterium]
PAAPLPVWHAACAGPCPSGPAESTTPRPTRIAIPRIGVDADLEVLGTDPSGALRPPSSYAGAGWFGQGPSPGDTGPAVIAGHVDSKTGPAVFYRLHELRTGDAVSVRRGDDWVRFRVVSLSRYAKDRFPTDAVYGPTPVPELRLVTCDGEFDRRGGHYRDNLVVFAVADRPATGSSRPAG